MNQKNTIFLSLDFSKFFVFKKIFQNFIFNVKCTWYWYKKKIVWTFLCVSLLSYNFYTEFWNLTISFCLVWNSILSLWYLQLKFRNTSIEIKYGFQFCLTIKNYTGKSQEKELLFLVDFQRNSKYGKRSTGWFCKNYACLGYFWMWHKSILV